MERLRASSPLLRTVVTVMAASPFLTRTCVTDPKALDVLAAPDQPVEPLEPLSRWKALEVLRVAALDLGGQSLPRDRGAAPGGPGRRGARLGHGIRGLTGELAVIAMGKLGARELNYGSDIDVVLVGRGDPQSSGRHWPGPAWRIDLGLRPEGRSGPLVRSLASYTAYWDRWAADMGVPGPAESEGGGRPRRAGRKSSSTRHPGGCGAGRSAPTSCGRCGP